MHVGRCAPRFPEICEPHLTQHPLLRFARNVDARWFQQFCTLAIEVCALHWRARFPWPRAARNSVATGVSAGAPPRRHGTRRPNGMPWGGRPRTPKGARSAEKHRRSLARCRPRCVAVGRQLAPQLAASRAAARPRGARAPPPSMPPHRRRRPPRALLLAGTERRRRRRMLRRSAPQGRHATPEAPGRRGRWRRQGCSPIAPQDGEPVGPSAARPRTCARQAAMRATTAA